MIELLVVLLCVLHVLCEPFRIPEDVILLDLGRRRRSGVFSSSIMVCQRERERIKKEARTMTLVDP